MKAKKIGMKKKCKLFFFKKNINLIKIRMNKKLIEEKLKGL